MSSITGVAASGLAAQSQRLNASAANVANLRSRGAVPDASGVAGGGAQTTAGPAAGQPQAYQPIQAVQTAVSAGQQPAGTRAAYTPITPAYIPEYDPGASYANADGLVAAPNVDPATETVNQMTAATAYKANLQTLKTEDEMIKSILDAKV